MLLNNNPYEPGQIITEEGDYSLHIKAWDTLKNTSELNINFIIDKTMPSITLNTQVRPLYIINTSVNISKEKHDKEVKVDKKYNYYYKSLTKAKDGQVINLEVNGGSNRDVIKTKSVADKYVIKPFKKTNPEKAKTNDMTNEMTKDTKNSHTKGGKTIPIALIFIVVVLLGIAIRFLFWGFNER